MVHVLTTAPVFVANEPYTICMLIITWYLGDTEVDHAKPLKHSVSPRVSGKEAREQVYQVCHQWKHVA